MGLPLVKKHGTQLILSHRSPSVCLCATFLNGPVVTIALEGALALVLLAEMEV